MHTEHMHACAHGRLPVVVAWYKPIWLPGFAATFPAAPRRTAAVERTKPGRRGATRVHMALYIPVLAMLRAILRPCVLGATDWAHVQLWNLRLSGHMHVVTPSVVCLQLLKPWSRYGPEERNG